MEVRLRRASAATETIWLLVEAWRDDFELWQDGGSEAERKATRAWVLDEVLPCLMDPRYGPLPTLFTWAAEAHVAAARAQPEVHAAAKTLVAAGLDFAKAGTHADKTRAVTDYCAALVLRVLREDVW